MRNLACLLFILIALIVYGFHKAVVAPMEAREMGRLESYIRKQNPDAQDIRVSKNSLGITSFSFKRGDKVCEGTGDYNGMYTAYSCR